MQYIKAHRKGFYTTLLTKCELNRHLADVNKQAEDMFFRLIKQMAERDGVTEQLKAATWDNLLLGGVFCCEISFSMVLLLQCKNFLRFWDILLF